MRRIAVTAWTLVVTGLALGACPVNAAAVTARVTRTGATLANGLISQAWTIGSTGVTTGALIDVRTHRDWALPGSPEFSMVVDSAPTSSTAGWRLISAAAHGDSIAFRYGLALPRGLVELDRTWTLYPGAAVEQVSEQLVNHTSVALRIGEYTLAAVRSPARVSAEVQAYHGGSDWRQDFRVITREVASFDDEGEVARFDDGSGAGWFLVGERRGGAMSRVGRTSAGRSWVGVDNARDLFDWGPILTSPPNYNRQTNPAYPAPIRQRTLLSLGALDLGTAYVGVYHGGAGQAAAAFASDFAAHVAPTRRQTVDLNSFHPWGHGSGLADANLRPQARAFSELGGEVFMLDDQWQGRSAGDWRWDPERFPIPSGSVAPAFATYLHSLGLQLGLWMSPAEFNPRATIYAQHPNWACTPTGDVTALLPDDSGLGVWDFTNPQLRAYMSGVINRLIAQDGVREFKFDYVTWVDCPPHDYLDYEDAYVHWIQALEAAHPGVTFELDETNDQRLWPFRSAALGPSWFDNGHLQGSTYPSRLLHDIWSSAPWIPPSTLGFGTYDGDLGAPYTPDYLMPIALLGHVTFWSDLTKQTPREASETAWWLGWYRAHRAALSALVYEDSVGDPIDGRAWAAFQPWRGGRGYLFLFSQGGGTQTQTVSLQDLVPSRTYVLRDVRTGETIGRWTGARLRAGVPFTLSGYTALVLAVTPS
jgi:hypothetical protein